MDDDFQSYRVDFDESVGYDDYPYGESAYAYDESGYVEEESEYQPQDMDEERVGTFKETQQVGFGLDIAEGRLGEIQKRQKTQRERRIDEASELLSSNIFESVQRNTKNLIISTMKEIPDLEFLNSELLILSLLWKLQKRKATKSEIKEFLELYPTDAPIVDFVRYTRMEHEK